MSDLYCLPDEQMAWLQPFFPKRHGRPQVYDIRRCDAPLGAAKGTAFGTILAWNRPTFHQGQTVLPQPTKGPLSRAFFVAPDGSSGDVPVILSPPIRRAFFVSELERSTRRNRTVAETLIQHDQGRLSPSPRMVDRAARRRSDRGDRNP